MYAAIFDLDGVIVLAEPFEIASINETLAPFNISFDFDYFINRFSGQGSRSIFEQIIKERQLDVDIEELLREKRRRMEEKVETQTIPVVPGVLEFIKQLREQHVPFMVGTGGDKTTARKKLEKIGLDIDIIATEDVKRGKPAPDIYLACAKHLRVDPSSCVVFEDAPSGVHAAKSAGMKCVGVLTDTDEKHLLDAGADKTIKNFEGLEWERLIEELF
ncbi:HAD family phosphatase [Candidatus Woesearchaeota archaeon]|nr:MAG: HAD family phosphatase [Candidatus Woesearchaeota archaeon]